MCAHTRTLSHGHCCIYMNVAQGVKHTNHYHLTDPQIHTATPRNQGGGGGLVSLLYRHKFCPRVFAHRARGIQCVSLIVFPCVRVGAGQFWWSRNCASPRVAYVQPDLHVFGTPVPVKNLQVSRRRGPRHSDAGCSRTWPSDSRLLAHPPSC